MDPSALRTLEYAKVVARLAEYTSTQRGRELVEALQPLSDRTQVMQELDLTSDAVAVLRQAPAVPLGGIRDLRQTVGRARIGGGLSGEELLAVGSTLRAVRLMKGFFADLPDPVDALQGWAKALSYFEPQSLRLKKRLTIMEQ